MLAWSTEDLVESHFVKATDAFGRSKYAQVSEIRILVLVNCPEQQIGGDEPFLRMKVTSPELTHNFLQIGFEEHCWLKRFGFVSSGV